MLVDAVIPVVVAVAALFPIVAVGPVIGVAVALLPSIVNAEAAAAQICTNYIVAALLFWAHPLLKHCSLYTPATYLVMVHALHPGAFENLCCNGKQLPLSV